MFKIQRWHQLRTLKNHSISYPLWHNITEQLPLIRSLGSVDKAAIRALATLFLYEKTFSGAGGLAVDERMQITIAAQACLAIRHLGMDAYDGWKEIIIYPGAFRVNRETQNESGLVSSQDNVLSGESWGKGPVILSWEDVARDSFEHHKGSNVVIHEFAHKLDMLNGRANGMPPLHPDMHIEEWAASLSKAYEKLTKRVAHHHAHINAYATTNPAEFFAVVCEYFFTAPEVLLDRYPKVYDQLQRYFRQNPLAALSTYHTNSGQNKNVNPT